MPPRGRLAPTPSGLLHLGNARSFLAAWLSMRQQGGEVVLRIEDIDRDRCRPALEEEQRADLAWLGLSCDLGNHPETVVRQSDRLDHYQAAFEVLRDQGLVYPCTCSRKDILNAQSAPHHGDELHYPGTCRHQTEEEASASGRPWAWRLRVEPEVTVFTDIVAGEVRNEVASDCGDFVVMRKDGWPSYQLAVVVDDAAQAITEVVRGDDLVSNTARQLLLYRHLGLTPPQRWAHLPLVLDADGQRMAKRRDSTALSVLRQRPTPPESVVGMLAHSLGLTEVAAPSCAAALIDAFDWARVPRQPVILEVPS